MGWASRTRCRRTRSTPRRGPAAGTSLPPPTRRWSAGGPHPVRGRPPVHDRRRRTTLGAGSCVLANTRSHPAPARRTCRARTARRCAQPARRRRRKVSSTGCRSRCPGRAERTASSSRPSRCHRPPTASEPAHVVPAEPPFIDRPPRRARHRPTASVDRRPRRRRARPAARPSIAAATTLADQPLFAASDAPGNLALAPLGRVPDGDERGSPDRDYSPAQEYLGFFDPNKCYRYLGATAATTTAVGNGSFETPSQGGGYSYSPTGATWVFANGAGLTANQSAFTNGNPNTADGQQVAFLQNGGTATQTFTATAGTTYTVAFRAAQRGNSQQGTQIVRVSIDGVALGTFQPPGTAYTSSPTYTFTATSSSHTIQLAGVGGGGSDYTAFVDSVVVVDASSPAAAPADYFRPVGLATARRCSGEWSGNFLNWATTQVIDPFRWVLTGGYRVVDTTTTTVIEKAWGTEQGGTGNFPDSVLSAAEVAGRRRSARPGRRSTCGSRASATRCASPCPTPRARGVAVALRRRGAVQLGGGRRDEHRLRRLRARPGVRPVGRAGGLESQLRGYGANYKPEGLIQQYADKMRYSAFGYLNDSNMPARRRRPACAPEVRRSDAAGARVDAGHQRGAANGIRRRASSSATRPADATGTPTRCFGTERVRQQRRHELPEQVRRSSRRARTRPTTRQRAVLRGPALLQEPGQRARVDQHVDAPAPASGRRWSTASRSSPTGTTRSSTRASATSSSASATSTPTPTRTCPAAPCTQRRAGKPAEVAADTTVNAARRHQQGRHRSKAGRPTSASRRTSAAAAPTTAA